ncbi:MAG: alpha/beta hydrolase family protein [Candidatus Geothermincolia bacterium]
MRSRRLFAWCITLLVCSMMLGAPALAPAAATSPQPGSPEYINRDLRNIADAYGRQTAPDGQLSLSYMLAFNRSFGPAYLLQLSSQVALPNRPALTAGQLVPGWNLGNPYRTQWSGKRGLMVPVCYTNRYGALIRGDLFAPLPGARDPYTGHPLVGPYPGVIITPGSVQGSEHMYWWLAQDLAERGYLVMVFDVQGQGTSETLPHGGSIADLPYYNLMSPTLPGEMTPIPGFPFQQASNFVYGTLDAMDFFLSTPDQPYPNPQAGTAPVNACNPLWEQFDRRPDMRTATPGRTTRLAIVGHSLGAMAVSYVQSIDDRVAAVVALDKLNAEASSTGALFNTPVATAPVVPAMGIQSEYGFNVAPYFANPGIFNFDGLSSPDQAPDPYRELKTGYNSWKEAGVDTMVIVPRASTHLEYTDIPWVLPASRFGQDVASYYAQAWLAKYLKHDPSADAALLATSFRYLEPAGMSYWKSVTLNRADRLSFYFCSGYDFATLSGTRVVDDDIAGITE